MRESGERSEDLGLLGYACARPLRGEFAGFGDKLWFTKMSV